METEIDRLKRNTEQERWKQIHLDLAAYINKLSEEIDDRERWHSRARNLDLTMLFVHFGTILIPGIQGVPYEDYGWIVDVSLLVWFITILRSSVIHTQVISATREQIGVIHTLRLLGMIKDDDFGKREKKPVKRWSPFARYKEFWERITENKTQEKYA